MPSRVSAQTPTAEQDIDRGTETPIIRICGVSREFRGCAGAPSVLALKNVTFDVRKHEFVSIVGPSGCGKSTLLRLICGLIEPSEGSVYISGAPVSEAKDKVRFGFVFQEAALLPWRNALLNVRLPFEIAGTRGRKEAESRCEELLDLMLLRGFSRSYPGQLSGGMRQRVAIARALACDPEILLMDEPFGALDEITREELNDELMRIWAEIGSTTVVFVTHNLAEALYMSDRVVVMSARPGQVRAVCRVDLPRPREASLRLTPAFVEQLSSIRRRMEEV